MIKLRYCVAHEEGVAEGASQSYFRILREAEQGAVIIIERHGEPVAELRPITAPSRMPAGKKVLIFDSMREIWARMPKVADSSKIIEEDRDR